MGFKNRGYKRDTEGDLIRDYKLFAIACEGSDREPQYFNVFRDLSRRIKVDVIEEDINRTNSSPKWVLNRLTSYIEKYDLQDTDELWIVIDVDNWKDEEVRNVASYCNDQSNWNIAISNPCFEVWLYFHKRKDVLNSSSVSCKDFKSEIATFSKNGYNKYQYILLLEDAIRNAKQADSNKNHFLPKEKETKVYLLIEAMLAMIKSDELAYFFSEEIPKLAKGEAKI